MVDEVKRLKKNINGVEIEVLEKEIEGYGLNIQAGTNGFQSGDAGHGSRTFFKFSSRGCLYTKSKLIDSDSDNGFEIELSGDWELSAMKDALRFALETLEMQSK